MTRVKRGTIANKRRKKILKLAKGYRFGRSRKERAAKEAIRHAGNHAFRDRRAKKRVFRRLWTTRINAALRAQGSSYAQFINAMKKKSIGLDRKVLSLIAQNYPATFERIVKKVGSSQ